MTFTWHEILLNIIIPFVISAIVKPDWDPRLKYGIAMVSCVAASAAEFYLSVWIVGGVQSTFFEAFSKSFLVIFATYGGILKFPPFTSSGTTLAAKLESVGEVRLPAEVLELLAAQAAANRKAAEVQQVVGEAVKAREVVAEETKEVAEAEDKK